MLGACRCRSKLPLVASTNILFCAFDVWVGITGCMPERIVLSWDRNYRVIRIGYSVPLFSPFISLSSDELWVQHTWACLLRFGALFFLSSLSPAEARKKCIKKPGTTARVVRQSPVEDYVEQMWSMPTGSPAWHVSPPTLVRVLIAKSRPQTTTVVV